jgi:hypothetical protein
MTLGHAVHCPIVLDATWRVLNCCGWDLLLSA